jgi:hypothetical protein
MSHVAREQNALCTQINPGERQVGNIDPPVLRLLLDMSFETETISATVVACEEALVIFPAMFVSDATANLKERGKQGRVLIRGCWGPTPETTGGLGIKEAMSTRGIEAEVPLSKRIWYIAGPAGLE